MCLLAGVTNLSIISGIWYQLCPKHSACGLASLVWLLSLYGSERGCSFYLIMGLMCLVGFGLVIKQVVFSEIC